MKKKNILNLIRYHAENNDPAFRNEAYEIARYFDSNGNYQMAEYIMGVLSDAHMFSPQSFESESIFLKKIDTASEPLPLPSVVADDIKGIINAIYKNMGLNKFLFEGHPGTGKTETAKQVARILERELFMVEFEAVIDSKLGQTAKNIANLFDEINQTLQPSKIVILFDEIDALAVDRINKNDLREMGRATSAVLKGLDSLNEKIVIIATTNLFSTFDKALIRRFDFTVNFNRYEHKDLIEVAASILNAFLLKFKIPGRNMKLFKKIISLMKPIPYPGELKSLIKTSLAFSNPTQEFDYLRKLLGNILKDNDFSDIKKLHDDGFTLREIELLTGTSKSQIARELKGE